MNATRGLAGALALGLLACGGEVNGKLEGNSLKVIEAVFIPKKSSSDSSIRLDVFLADQPGLCTALGKNQILRSSNVIQITVFEFGEAGNQQSVRPVEFPVEPVFSTAAGRHGSLFFSNFDSGCVRTLINSTATGQSGSIKLESFDQAKRASGTFAGTFGNGEKLDGKFDATLCDVPSPEGAAGCS